MAFLGLPGGMGRWLGGFWSEAGVDCLFGERHVWWITGGSIYNGPFFFFAFEPSVLNFIVTG